MMWVMGEKPRKMPEVEFDREYLAQSGLIVVNADPPGSSGREVVVFWETKKLHELWELQGGDMVQTKVSKDHPYG